MDDINAILPAVPFPGLSTVHGIFKSIWEILPQVQASQKQFLALVHFIARLLQILDSEYRAGRVAAETTSKPLGDLRRILNEILVFIKKETTRKFLKSLLTKADRVAQIEGYYPKVSCLLAAFQISTLFDTSEWQSENEDGKRIDQQLLSDRLSDLESDPDRLTEALNDHGGDSSAIMVCLRRRLDSQLDDERERQFFKSALQYLTTYNGYEVEVENWMITAYEVEFGHRIGVGGFGEVYKGVWNKTPVAIKVLKTDSGITPSSAAIRREIETWSTMRHTHILQFLGANELDNRPFIVMPYLKNGNARDYIRTHPNCHRLRMIHHVSLGLVYLHSHGIIHGDLKALNVLIDDAENAVLCDFGLSRIKADVTSRIITAERTYIVGSRNWMAPERLQGRTLKKPSDIYALGMIIYEIFTNEIPLDDIVYEDFIELVVRQDVRPERPSGEDAPHLSDMVWALAERCWVKEAKDRPLAGVVCNTISSLLEIDAATTARAAIQVTTSPPQIPASPAQPPAIILPPVVVIPDNVPSASSTPIRRERSLPPPSPRIFHDVILSPHFNSARTFRFSPKHCSMKEGDLPLCIGRFSDSVGWSMTSIHKITFKSLVVSRAHAELWFGAGGRLFIRDTKSSSGTFLNNVRLSPPLIESQPHQIKDGDILQLGEDLLEEKGEIYNSVKIRIGLEKH